MPLYHAEVGIPASARGQIKPIFGLHYSPHAREEAVHDRYGHVKELPRHFLPRVAKVIEVETDDQGKLVKVLARQQYDARDDIVYAVNVATKVVKTVWRNSRNDTHRTLDRAKYALP
jgi:hypothetical protein